MNRTLKRVLGLTASVTLGLAGAVAFASGAQAHHTEVAPTTDCLAADGSWTVTWSATDWAWKSYGDGNLGAGTITKVTSTPDVALNGDIAVGETLPYPGEGSLTATQTFGADVEQATLVIKAEWPNGQKGDNKQYLKTAYKPTQLCEPDDEPSTPAPVADAQQESWSDCFGLTVWVANLNPDKLATFTISPSNGDSFEVTPEAGQEGETFDFPASETGDLTVDVSVDGGEPTTHAWAPAENCDFGEYFDTCEGLDFNLMVPADGVETTYTFTTSENEEPAVYVVAPGDTQEVSFEGTPGLIVYLLIENGKNPYPFEFEWTPCDETPSASETPSAAPQLPTTGSSLSIMIGSAAALIVAAAAILLIMRRRRAAQDW
ncbi:LPXTG cell wall anchor domain-containing protein [Glycomyces paridis]|uniref:LPXTG cell wall anchor domain-containing protein n=1 Tax=Glycomyces paridis TaxID=2126555 RepID=A0A4S8PKC2_9ACTN|nr:LPXTG cell wall anchor domain-containing protein [Glycomyces paridis]THV31213.1 LPXTG cell wall anchor domain-containing protein [Glycomyces paridis]